MPASVAAATSGGSSRISVPKSRLRPSSTVSTAAITYAPTASAKECVASAVTSSAAPGVDHAVTTGARCTRLSSTQVRPLPRDSAQSHDSSWPAPRSPARAACSTTATGPV